MYECIPCCRTDFLGHDGARTERADDWSVEHTQQGLYGSAMVCGPGRLAWWCMPCIAGSVTKEGKRIRKATMNIKTGLTALLMAIPLLASAGAREELVALEATKRPLLTLQPSPPPPFRFPRR